MEVWLLILTGLSTVFALVCCLVAVQAGRIARERYSSSRLRRDLSQCQLDVVDLRDLYEQAMKSYRKVAQRQTMRERKEREREEKADPPAPTYIGVPAECPDPQVDPAGFKRWHRLNTLGR